MQLDLPVWVRHRPTQMTGQESSSFPAANAARPAGIRRSSTRSPAQRAERRVVASMPLSGVCSVASVSNSRGRYIRVRHHGSPFGFYTCPSGYVQYQLPGFLSFKRTDLALASCTACIFSAEYNHGYRCRPCPSFHHQPERRRAPAERTLAAKSSPWPEQRHECQWQECGG